MNVLVTGGAGYIGSHTAVELIEAGYNAIIVDDLSNAKEDVIDRIETITGKRPVFYKVDCKDKEALRKVFAEHKIDSVIHFAAYKAVGQSVKIPLEYYRNNIDSTLTLIEVMEEFGCKKFVFSSSATVYGPNNPYPYKEEMKAIESSSPYGWPGSRSVTSCSMVNSTVFVFALQKCMCQSPVRESEDFCSTYS